MGIVIPHPRWVCNMQCRLAKPESTGRSAAQVLVIKVALLIAPTDGYRSPESVLWWLGVAYQRGSMDGSIIQAGGCNGVAAAAGAVEQRPQHAAAEDVITASLPFDQLSASSDRSPGLGKPESRVLNS